MWTPEAVLPVPAGGRDRPEEGPDHGQSTKRDLQRKRCRIVRGRKRLQNKMRAGI